VSSSLLFNQANSHYHLNISQSIFSSGKKSTIISLKPNFTLGAVSIFRYAQQIINGIENIKRTEIFIMPMMEEVWPEDKFSKIAMIFSESRASRVAPFVYLKMEFYASMLLSDYWDDLPNKDGKSVLMILINRDIYKSAVLVETNREVKELFCLFIYDLVLLIAQKSKNNIYTTLKNKSLNLNKMKYRLIPQVGYPDHLFNSVVELFYDREIGGSISPFYIFKSVKGVGLIEKQEELDIIALSKLNLLSKQ
jgi:hypothetical protein